jgi:hypothetical protein
VLGFSPIKITKVTAESATITSHENKIGDKGIKKKGASQV